VSNTSKTAKIIKRWYYSAAQWAHWHLGDVVVGNVTFFMMFAVFDVLRTHYMSPLRFV